jgi:putative DNA primase/helicase
MTPIDFLALGQALLDRAHVLVPQWLSGGVQRGKEWVCGGLSGEAGGSLSVNTTSGAWSDFATGEKGGDLISLFAAIEGLNNGQAARQLMHALGWQVPGEAAPQPVSRASASAPAPLPDSGPAPAPPAKRRSMWKPVVPVPAHAPPADFKHWHYAAPEATWAYERDGALFGHVVRFRTSTGGKEVLPFTWCVDEGDDRGTQRWHWKQWDEPRPLYLPAGLLSADGALPVVVVEGEKCALAGHGLLPGEFDFISWPGGGKAWDKADWLWLQGRTVYLWPDCDAKREPLTKAEREADVDPATKSLLPEHKQPGVQCMAKLGAHLQQAQGCTVFWCAPPSPGAVSDGWDIADAAAQGWGPEEVRAFIRAAKTFEVPDAEAAAGAARSRALAGASTPAAAGAGEEKQRWWRDALMRSDKGRVLPVRDNVVLALAGLPAEDLPGIEEAAGLIAFNDFTNDVIKRHASPWDTAAGVWEEHDELEMGNWLSHKHFMPSMSRQTLEEAVAMVAKRNRFHPVRERLEQLRGAWDGEKRLGTWLQRCCVSDDAEVDDRQQQYLARVGTWLVMAICARVLTPGCKFDYMTIFEGPQGWGKSTLARLLALEWFADTGLVLGDKDSYQNLQGVLVYEWGELDSLTRSEVTKVKQFISSTQDRFRASFDRRPKDYPRQVVFIGTTNEDHYLVDPTGNRRMWPVRISKPVDLDWMRSQREQLFAEAMTYVDAGERFHPTQKEQRELFEPQQQQRQIESAIQAACMRYLYDEHQRVTPTGENGALVNEISAPELLGKLGISVDKQTHVLLRQVTAALRTAGWTRFRSSRADRPWMFKRPKGAAGLVAGADGFQSGATPAPSQTETADACPF